MDSVTLALFMTVPAAFGALAQAFMTNIKRFCVDARRLALSAMAVQIAGLLLMAYSLILRNGHSSLMFIGQCMYWIGGMTSASPTQEILAHNVDPSFHNRFFSRRAMLMTVLTLVCNLSSAKILEGSLTNNLMATFLIVAAATRLISLSLVYVSARKITPVVVKSTETATEEAVVSIIKLSLVMMLFRCAVNLSSPFYSTYMLQEIDLGFTVYSFLTALPLITKALCLTNWARLLDDNRKFEGLAIATFAIGAVPVMWAMNASTPWLSLLQVLSGLSWAGFDLISILLVQNMYPRSITQKLGVYMALSSLGSVAGGIIGGIILNLTSSYHLLFAFSGILRLLTGFGLLWYLRRHHLFRFKELRVKSGIATLMTVRPSIEAAAKILPINLRRDSRTKRVA